MKRVLYDTGVLLDVLLEREPHHAASVAALDAVGRGKVEGYVAGHTVTTLAYLLERRVGAGRSRAVLTDLLSQMRVAAVSDPALRQALASGLGDFEDAACEAAAFAAQVDWIVTRNTGGFSGGRVPAVHPDVFRPE